jgi:hypothetical protein
MPSDSAEIRASRKRPRLRAHDDFGQWQRDQLTLWQGRGAIDGRAEPEQALAAVHSAHVRLRGVERSA